MTCPKCGEESRVVDSRDSLYVDVPAKRRRRRCNGCARAWTTYEIEASAYAAIVRANRMAERLEGPLGELMGALADVAAAREVA